MNPRRQHYWAVGTILMSAVLFALPPLIVHQTARNSNPFYFNGIAHVVQLGLILLALALTRTWLRERPLKILGNQRHNEAMWRDPPSLHSPALHLSYFFAVSTKDDGHERVILRTASPKKPTEWLRTPLFWASISGMNYGFLAWSSQYIETAVAATIYELWPLVLVFWIGRQEQRDQLYRQVGDTSSDKVVPITTEQKTYMYLAVFALGFMYMAQRGTDDITSEIFSFSAIVGLVIATASAVLVAINVVVTLVYGRALYYHFVDEQEDPLARSSVAIRDRGPMDIKLLTWFTILAFVPFRVVSIPVTLVVGGTLHNASPIVTIESSLGAVALGIVVTVAVVLLRIGNIQAPSAGVNALFLLSPVLAIGLLVAVGIELERVDLYAIGATLIVALNILIQLKPDEERDRLQFGKRRARGIKLGFAAFIISLWLSGTVVYLRHEWFNTITLSWEGAEYWALIALSATIFALILGFRIVRLTGRIEHEDEIMLGVFRSSQFLVRRGILSESFVTQLSTLDTARQGELRGIYNVLRQELAACSCEVEDREDALLLLELEKELDGVTHSKQQGRDIVELLSLTTFAGMTVALGLLAVPPGLDSGYGLWTGFLSEVFVMLFVSTIAFLCFNLFDIRRDRETPLLVTSPAFGDDYWLFFRRVQDAKWRYLAAVLVSLTMTAVFCVLLYLKWL